MNSVRALFVVLFAHALSCLGADMIQVEVRFIEAPPSLEITSATDLGTLSDTKDASILAAPRVRTFSGQPATVELVEETKVPDVTLGKEAQLPVGVVVKVRAEIQGDAIKFMINTAVREAESTVKLPGGEGSEFVVREHFMSGTAREGEQVVFASKAVREGKRLTIMVSFRKIAPDPKAE